MQDYLSEDLLQYVLNPYLDWEDDVPKLKILYNIDFIIKIHLIIDEFTINMEKGICKLKQTFLDGKFIKYERWWENGNKNFEQNYKNEKLDGKQYYYYENGNAESEQNYKNGKEEGEQYIYNQNGD